MLLLVLNVFLLKHIETIDEDSLIDLSIFAGVSEQSASLSDSVSIDSGHNDFLGVGNSALLEFDSFGWFDDGLVESSGELDDLQVVLDDVDGHVEESVAELHHGGESFSDSSDHVLQVLFGALDAGLLSLVGEPNSDCDFDESLVGVVRGDHLDVEFLKGFLDFSQRSFAGNDFVLDLHCNSFGDFYALHFHNVSDHGL